MPQQSSVIPDAWPINITGHDVKPASWFLAHHKNVQVHPRAQQEATEGSLNALGWVKSVTVNVRTAASWAPGERGVNTLLDGHERVMLALRRGDETPIPVEFVDLDLEQEDLFLLIIDEIARMAMKDKGRLDSLLHEVKPQDAALAQMLSDLAAREGLYGGNGGEAGEVLPPDDFKEYGEDIETQYCCPKCGYEWSGQSS